MNVHAHPAKSAAAADSQPYPPARQAWYCVIVLALAVMVNFLDRGILALLIQPIKKDLQLSDMQLSLIMGFAFTFFYAVLGLPVARLIDRGTRMIMADTGLDEATAAKLLEEYGSVRKAVENHNINTK